MKTIVHLSDLHFGNADSGRIPNLINQIKSLNPDLVIISGDLTERATESQFAEAKKFIDSFFDLPLFVIPGNHDIPLYNIYKRFTAPFDKYHKHISKDTAPFLSDEDLCIVGVNSVRKYSLSSGGIGRKQVKDAMAILEKAHSQSIKIIVSHHPFDMPDIQGYRKYTHRLMTNSGKTLERLSQSGVDLFLSGHLHVPFVSHEPMHHRIKNWSSLIIHAGTAASERTRGAPVSFNVLRISSPTLVIEHYNGNLHDSGYTLSKSHNFKKNNKGWKKV